MGIVAVCKDVTLLEEEWGNGYNGGTKKMSRYWEKRGEMGIVAVRKDVTLLEEECGNGYNGVT